MSAPGSAPGRPRTVMELIRLAADHLRKSGVGSARLDAELLLGHVLGVDRLALYVGFDRPVMEDEVAAYRRLIAARARRVPVAYLVGYKEFCGLRFAVDPNVLIPRPETELLVERLVGYLTEQGDRHDGAIRVVDVGTGSGAIAVSVAVKVPTAHVYATDLSPAALAVAARNAQAHGVQERVTFLSGNLLGPLPRALMGHVHAVACNPPYIPTPELGGLEPEVRQEPRLALDGGPDGLAVYRKLCREVGPWLQPGGMLVLEVGAGQSKPVQQLLSQPAGRWRTEVYHDYAGYDRIVTAFTIPERH